MMESPADCKVVVRHADKSSMLSEGFTWVKVELRNCDGSAADPGSCYIRFQDGWTPSEAIVDAGLSGVPLQWAKGSEHHLRSQATLGYANTRLKQVNLVNAEVIPQGSTSPQQATLTKGRKPSNTTPMVMKTERDKGPPHPPQNVMTQLDPQQQKSFSRLWSRIPKHLQMIRFARQSSLATPRHRCTRRYPVRIRASVFKAQHRPGTRHR